MDNTILEIGGFLDSETCDAIMSQMDKAIGMGMGLDRRSEALGIHKEDMQLYPKEILNADFILTKEQYTLFNDKLWSVAYPQYLERFPVLSEYARHTCYGVKLQRTRKTEGYHVWHAEDSAKELSGRLLTFILYLNDVEEGGETELLYQSLRIKPEKGKFILFPATFTHTHRGNPPISNSKYIATGWIEF